MIGRIQRFIRQSAKPTESESDRDGFLSYAGEYHSLTIGMYRGLTKLPPWEDDFKTVAERYDDVAAEPWSYKGGYLLGTAIQLGTLALFIHWGMGL